MKRSFSNYKIIKTSSNPNKIGSEYPQTESRINKDLDDLGFLARKKGERVAVPLTLDNIRLATRAKLTDVISCSLGAGNDIIISPRLYEILKTVKIGPTQFFNVSFIYKQTEIKDYYWMHFVYELEPFIAVNKTEYNYRHFPKLKHSKFQSYDEFQNFCQFEDEWSMLQSTKTVLSSSFDKNLDLFVLSQIDQNIYISIKLYECFLDHGITGLDYEDGKLYFNS